MFLASHTILTYLLPLAVCAVLVWRFGERSHWRLVPMVIIIIITIDFMNTVVISFLEGFLRAFTGNA